MPRPDPRIAAYHAKFPPTVRRVLRELRAAIVAAAPEAESHFSYQMPGFRLHGKTLVWYAAWKSHLGLYPIGPEIVAQHAKALTRCTCAKGTLRFPLDAPPSAALVRKLVRARIALL